MAKTDPIPNLLPPLQKTKPQSLTSALSYTILLEPYRKCGSCVVPEEVWFMLGTPSVHSTLFAFKGLQGSSQ